MTVAPGLWKQLETSSKQVYPLSVDAVIDAFTEMFDPEKALRKKIQNRVLVKFYKAEELNCFSENEHTSLTAMIHSKDVEDIELAEIIIDNIKK